MKVLYFLVGGMLLLCFPRQAGAALSDTPDVKLPGTDRPVRAIVQFGNRIYVGGDFTRIGGVVRNGLAAIDASTGQVDPKWDPDIPGEVECLAVAHGRVYAGGVFSAVNGGAVARTKVAAFRLADGVDTGQADPWNPLLSLEGSTVRPTVNSLGVSAARVYIGGWFDAVNGTRRTGIAALEPAGTAQAGQLDAAWNPDLGPELNIRTGAIEVTSQHVYLGLTVTHDPPYGYPALVALEPADGVRTGARDPAWRPLFAGRMPTQNWVEIYDLQIHDGYIYACGDIGMVQGITRHGLVALNLADGVHPAVVDPDWDPNIVPSVTLSNEGVNSITVADQRLVAGGSFPQVNGNVIQRYLAAFDLAGNGRRGDLDLTWRPDVSAWIDEVSPSGTGFLFGGEFGAVNGEQAARLSGFGSTVPVELSSFSVN